MRLDAALLGEASASDQLLTATERASSGKTVSSPADDPAAFARIATATAEASRLDARSRSLTGAQADLEVGDAALGSAADLVAQARDLAVQMADGSYSAGDRAIAANQVTSITEGLVSLANTRGQDGYILGGTASQSPPFSSAGAFNGNDNPQLVELSTQTTIRSNASGANAFTAQGGRDVFQDLAALATALSTNNVAGVQNLVGAMKSDQTQVVTARASVGVTLDRVRSAAQFTQTLSTTVQSAIAKDQGADSLKTYTDLSSAQAAYQRSLEMAKRALATLNVSPTG